MLMCVVVLTAVPAFAELDLKHRWVYVPTNLLMKPQVDKVITLMVRAKKCGYTGIMLADGKFAMLDSFGREYDDNARRVIAKAKELDLEIIPSIFSIGYSSGILSHDVNLVEGLPVKDALFDVTGGKLMPVFHAETELANGDFETIDSEGGFTGWWQEDIGKSVHVDRNTVKDGKTSVRLQDIGTHSPQHGNSRFRQIIKTKPFQYYHLSVWIKTENFEKPSGVNLLVLAKKPSNLAFQQLGVKQTQDWTEHHIAFNSLDNTEVRVYAGVWNGQGGKVWFDGLKMEPGGFVNVIRRDGTPIKLTTTDGRTVLAEGRDYSQVVDPKLGNSPQWAGTYDVWHSPPVVGVPAGSRLKEGDRVLASYYHSGLTMNTQVTCNLMEPKLYRILDDEMKNVHELFGAKSYMMSHDEIRVGGWTPDYDGTTMGEALATNVGKCVGIIRKYAPEARIHVWNDMFDPNHNAKADRDYYLVKTTLAGSWKGLPKEVIPVDWLAKSAPKTMQHFADIGNTEQMMAGYYDEPDVAANVKKWIDAAKASPAKVTGIMYTTWQNDYSRLEDFADEVKKQEK